MLAAAAVVRQDLLSKRTDEYFRNILTTVNSASEELDLDPLALPRYRKVPAHYCSGTSTTHEHKTVETFYRAQNFALIDDVAQQISDRFASDKVG
jgi:hypothetical protein